MADLGQLKKSYFQAREDLGAACELCGTTSMLVWHHRDESLKKAVNYWRLVGDELRMREAQVRYWGVGLEGTQRLCRRHHWIAHHPRDSRSDRLRSYRLARAGLR